MRDRLNAAEPRRCLLPRSGSQGATAVSVISGAETTRPSRMRWPWTRCDTRRHAPEMGPYTRTCRRGQEDPRKAP